MAVTPAAFMVEQVIVHDVPQNSGAPAASAVVLSELPIPDLDAARRNFFRERIAASLAGHGYAVEPDPVQPSQVPSLVAGILSDPSTLVAASQEIAVALYAAQNRANSPGLLLVLLGKLGSNPGVAILKLQRHEGLRMSVLEVDGKRTFAATVLDDLTLTDDTRVFKASLFARSAETESGLEGLVSDEQRGYEARLEVANFFLRTFLGCRLKTAPDATTKAFFDASLDFLQANPDPEKRFHYSAALTAEIYREATIIRPLEFAERHIAVEDRQGYLEALESAGVTDSAIEKDATLVKPRVRSMSVVTDRRVRVTGPAEILEAVLEFRRDEDGNIIGLTISDGVAEIRGG